MNIERLTEIAEWLERGAPERDGVKGFYMPDFFSMSTDVYYDIRSALRVGEVNRADEIFRGCGTTCCIAGAAIAFYAEHPATVVTSVYTDEIGKAAELLELDYNTAIKLFAPAFSMDKIHPAWAARCVRKLIAVGVVDWLGTEGEPV